MFGILGEDKSDAETIKSFIRSIKSDDGIRTRQKGMGGSGELRKHGARNLTALHSLGCDLFVVCADADRDDPKSYYTSIYQQVIQPSSVQDRFCIVVPVQEIEAWILADIECLTQLFSSWRPSPVHNPESIDDPKEHLVRLSRDKRQKDRYSPTLHNPQAAKLLNLTTVRSKCPSFLPFHDFVNQNSCG